MSNTSKHIWIIPDTNILGNKGSREALINILRQFKDKNIEVGLPQIPIEESSKKDQSEQRTRSLSLYEIISKHFDEEDILYLQHLEEIKSEFPNDCCPAEEVPIALTVDVSRVGDEKHSYSYFVDEKTEEFLSKAIQKYIEKEVFSALKNLEHCGLESNQKDDVKKFQYALQFCLNLPDSADKGCKGHCKELYRVLSDILTLSPAYYLYYYQKEDKILVVSNDETVCETFNELVNDLFKGKDHTEEKKLIKCVNIKELEDFLKNAPETSQIDRQKLAKGFLDKALKDIKASEILYRENLQDLAIFHLEQVSEKILKAYFIVTQRESLTALLEKYKAAEENGNDPLKELAKLLNDPKSLRHDLVKFLNNEVKLLPEKICKEGINSYLEGLLKHYTTIPSNLSEQLIVYTKTDLKNAVCNEEAMKPTDIQGLYKKIKESQEPVIHYGIEIYRSYSEKIKDFLNNKYWEQVSNIMQLMNKFTFYNNNYINIKKEDLKTMLENLFYGVILPILIVPLHLFLSKYYNVSRYPEGNIPEEEYETIPDVIEILKEVHKYVEDIIQIFS